MNDKENKIYERYIVYLDSDRTPIVSRRYYDNVTALSDEWCELLAQAKSAAKYRAVMQYWRPVRWHIFRERIDERGHIYERTAVDWGTEDDK